MGPWSALLSSLLVVVPLLAGCSSQEHAATPDGASPTPACSNGLLDGNETDVDCGGAACAPCGQVARCLIDRDCAGGHCEGGACASSWLGFDSPRGEALSLKGDPALADLDGDGRLDVVAWRAAEVDTIGAQGDRLVWLRSLTGRRLGAPSVIAEVPAATGRAVAAGDLDGDGHADLAVASSRGYGAPDDVVVYWGGGAALSRGPSLPAGPEVKSLSIADVTGDRRPDLIVLTGVTQELLAVQVGADRALAKVLRQLVGPSPSGLALGDLDGDGVNDIAVGSSNGVHGYLGGAELRRVGSASLFTASRTPALSDLDGDGHLDAVIAYGGPLLAIRGNGDGSFDSSVAELAGWPADAVRGADVVASRGSGLLLSWMGQLHFVAPAGAGKLVERWHVTDGASWSVRSDVDGDGALDLVTAGSAVRVHYGAGDGALTDPASYIGAGEAPCRALAAGDFDGDGHLDLACATALPDVGLRRGDGTGRLGPPRALGFAGEPQRLVAGDLDGDGRSDLAVATWDRTALYFGRADGTLAPGPVFNEGWQVARSLLFADVDEDGALDVVYLRQHSVVVRRNLGGRFEDDGGVTLVRGAFAPTLASAALGDLNGDGHLDAVVSLYGHADDERVWLALGRGNGAFDDPRSIAPLDDTPEGLMIADADGDHHADVLAATSSFTDGRLLVIRGAGDGTFSAPTTFRPRFPQLRLPHVADVDRDGRPDLVDRAGADLRVHLGAANGRWYEAGRWPSTEPEFAIADFNSDGWPDLVDSLLVHLNRGKK